MENVGIASTNTIYRESLTELIQKMGGVCLFSAGSHESALSLFEEKKPEAMIIDIFSRGIGDNLISSVYNSRHECAMLLASSYSNPLLGYYSQKYKIESFVYVEDCMSKTAENIKLFLSGVGNGFNAAIQDFLTVRECEILKLIAAGKTSRQIADELFISKNTVDTHRNKMLQKLNLTNTASLVGYACSAGLI